MLLMRDVLLITWTLTIDLESGIFKDGGSLTVGAMSDPRYCKSNGMYEIVGRKEGLITKIEGIEVRP